MIPFYVDYTKKNSSLFLNKFIMASNVVLVNAYQLNQHPIPLANVTQVGLPTQGCTLGDCINSPQRALSTGVSVYSFAQVVGTGDKYYFQQTISALAALFNA